MRRQTKQSDYSRENGLGEIFLMGLGAIFLASVVYAGYEGYKIYQALPDMQTRLPAPHPGQVT
jgi:hypothetical protein